MSLKEILLALFAFTCFFSAKGQLMLEWDQSIPWSSRLTYEPPSNGNAESWWVYRNANLLANQLSPLGTLGPDRQNAAAFVPEFIQIREGDHYGGSSTNTFVKLHGPDSLVWINSLPLSTGIDLLGMDVSAEGNVYVTGKLSGGNHGFIAAFDTAGQFAWMDTSTAGGDWVGQKVQAEGDAVILVGYRADTMGARRLLIRRYDPVGNREFEDDSFVSPGATMNQVVLDVHRMPDSSITVTGNFLWIDVSFGWAAKFTSQGVARWVNYDIGLNPYIFHNVKSFPLANGHLLLCGTSGDEFGSADSIDYYALELDVNGYVMGNHFWGDQNSKEYMTDAVFSGDSVLYMWGYTRLSRCKLMAYDWINQNFLFSQEFGDSMAISSEIKEINQGFYLSNYNFGTNGLWNVFKLGYALDRKGPSPKMDLLIGPNPVVDLLSVEMPYVSNWKIRLLNVRGAVVTRMYLAGGKRKQIKMNGLEAGVYFVEVESEKGEKAVKKLLLMGR